MSAAATLSEARELAWAQAALPILEYHQGLSGPPKREHYEMLLKLTCSLSFDPRVGKVAS